MAFQRNIKQIGDAFHLLTLLPDSCSSLAFFDPQYRGVLDKMNYGNEGARQKERAALPAMTTTSIIGVLIALTRVIQPSGYVMLWLDKFELLNAASLYACGDLSIVDLVTWDKGRIGMGYRTRRRAEYLLIMQRAPIKAKATWTRHNIPDVWNERQDARGHTHAKPIGLQTALIEASTAPGSLVIDPCAGSYSVMTAAHSAGRDFIGCDLVYGGDNDTPIR